MANTTPSQSIKLGANLQEQLGDLKGAAKTLKEEAKAAEAAAKDAQKEIRTLEREQKKGKKVDLAPAQKRLLESKFEADQKKQRAKDLISRDKEQRAFKNEVDKRFGSFEKAATSQLYTVKDSLDMVSRKLSSSNGALAQSVGAKIASASAKISPSLIGTVAKFAGPVGAAYAGFKVGSKYVKAQHEFRDRGKQVSDIQGMTAESVAAEARSLVTRDLPKAFLKQLNETGAIAAKKGAGDIAREDLIQTDFAAFLRNNQGKLKTIAGLFGGTSGGLLSLLPDIEGATEKELRVQRRVSARTAEQQMLRGVGEQFGQPFAERVSLDAIMKSKTMDALWGNYLEENGGEKLISWFGDNGEKLVGKEAWVRKRAEEIQSGTISAESRQRASEKERAAQDPSAEAERHIRATRRNGLERQRLRREMQWNQI